MTWIGLALALLVVYLGMLLKEKLDKRSRRKWEDLLE